MTVHEVRSAWVGATLVLNNWDTLAKLSKRDRKKWIAEQRDKALPFAEPLVIDANWCWFVQSAATPTKFYETNGYSCECEGFQINGDCKHCELIRKRQSDKG